MRRCSCCCANYQVLVATLLLVSSRACCAKVRWVDSSHALLCNSSGGGCIQHLLGLLSPAIVLLQLEKERARLAKANKGDEASLNTTFTKMQHKQAKAEGVRRGLQLSLPV